MAFGIILLLLIVLYCGFLVIELRRYSQPFKSCDGKSPCFHPLLKPDDNLYLDLWTYIDVQISCPDSSETCPAVENNQLDLQWTRLASCNSIPITLSTPSSIVKYSNCTIPLPSVSRLRGHENGHPLPALFVLKRGNVVVAEAPFELTRMVKKKYAPDSDGPRQLFVPHYKYFNQQVVLRLVQEHRQYGSLVRGDGTRLQKHPGPCSEDTAAYCYSPILYVDESALLFSSQIEMAQQQQQGGHGQVKLHIKVSFVSPLRDVIIRHVAEGVRMAGSILHEEEIDEIRWFVSDENIYRFLLTQVISFVHLALDFVAFRDEVAFYVGRTDMGGLSMSSVVTRFICSFVILLYLCDQQRTSFIVLFSVFLGVVADGWKACKVLKPSISNVFPFVHFRDASDLSMVETETAKYDSIARAYLSLLFYPFIIGMALYARRHYSYNSTWSWAISNAANAVYTFGFIALCPQLYINYRLKSVSHLPWKVFVYKIFNTFIDDVFAFLIEMPLKHKLMTLRDDAIFLGFLIQCYLYRVDKSRCNEFGYAYEKDAFTTSSESPVNGNHSDGRSIEDDQVNEGFQNPPRQDSPIRQNKEIIK